MSDRHDEYLELCAGWALESLDEADRRRLEEHLASGCPACESAIADFSEATVRLAQSAPAVKPSRALRDRVLIAAGSMRGGSGASEGADGRGVVMLPQRRVAWSVWIPALAAAVFAIVAGVIWNRTMILRDRLAEERRLTSVLGAPGARTAVLEVTPQGEAALRARATYDPATRRAVIVFDHLRTPTGRDFELWAVRGAGVASLGVVRADSTGRAVVQVEDAGDPAQLQAFALSLEPEGGSPNATAPTGPVVMLGKLGS